MANWDSIFAGHMSGAPRPGNFPQTMDQAMVLNPNDPTVTDVNIIEPSIKTPDFITQVSGQPTNLASMLQALRGN